MTICGRARRAQGACAVVGERGPAIYWPAPHMKLQNASSLGRRLAVLLCLAATTSRSFAAESNDARRAPALRQVFLEQFARAYFPGRTGQIVVVPREGNIITRRDPAVTYMHGSPWPYDTRIPFLIYGPAFVRAGTYSEPVAQQDMAPTLAALLGVPMPATSVGRSLRTIFRPAPARPRLIVLAVLDGMRVDYFDRYAAARGDRKSVV